MLLISKAGGGGGGGTIPPPVVGFSLHDVISAISNAHAVKIFLIVIVFFKSIYLSVSTTTENGGSVTCNVFAASFAPLNAAGVIADGLSNEL
jgi:hypothetical protein